MTTEAGSIKAAPTKAALVVVLAGNPNSGKTSVFNALTGLRRKVGNYPGVTVDRVEGEIALPDGSTARMVDLPGTYSLFPQSEDERIARDVLMGRVEAVGLPDVIVAVVDASNLERNLYLATQVIEIGRPVVIALNMIDVATKRGQPIDTDKLAAQLGVPVIPVTGRSGRNMDALRAAIPAALAPGRRWKLPAMAELALAEVRTALEAAAIIPSEAADGEALRLLTSADDSDPALVRAGHAVRDAVTKARQTLGAQNVDATALEAECRYAFARAAAFEARGNQDPKSPKRSEGIDKVLTHRVVGPVIFLAVMGLIFMSVYEWAGPLMELIETGTGWLGGIVGSWLGDGMLKDLLVDGVIAGVGNIVIFVPQICMLFLYLTILEDSGYLARAAFLIDRPMRAAGLSGKSFVPLMSSFACAIPGIMAARTISNRRERFVTILVAPLMSCSARMPVYLLIIGVFFAKHEWVVLLSMYTLSIVAALGVAWILRKTLFRGESSEFILELPPYRIPRWGNVVRTVLGKGWIFIKQAGTVILAFSILLWFLAYFPRSAEIETEATTRVEAGEDAESVENWQAGAQMAQSYAGRIGKFIEPAIEPLGYDWKTGVGLIASFAAREVMVSTMGIVYSVGETDEESVPLRDRMKNDKKPDGSPVHTPLSGISLLVFFVLACQCMSTLAVAKRETKSWRWPIFMFVYMTVLAYVAALAVYQGGMALGFGP